jgi:hypothetical protein
MSPRFQVHDRLRGNMLNHSLSGTTACLAESTRHAESLPRQQPQHESAVCSEPVIQGEHSHTYDSCDNRDSAGMLNAPLSSASSSSQGTLNLIEDDEGDTSLNALRQETRIRAAMDSGSCRNVTHPKTCHLG